MMTTLIPKVCLDEIQRLQRRFIWGDTDDKRKFHAVKWRTVCMPKSRGGLGLRQLDTMNKACLLRWGWKLQLNGSDLWSSVLRGKYWRHGGLFDRCKPTDSSLWKSIVRLAPNLDHYGFWIIRDGQTVSAWNHAWITPGMVIADLDLHIPSVLQNVTVAALVDEMGNWKWSELIDWLPTDLLLRFRSFPTPSIDYGSDERMGIGEQSAEYVVSDMYNILSGFRNMEDNSRWCKVWKLRVPERVCSFVWLMMHERLLTNARKNRMGLGHAMCRYCGDIVENELHAIRDCPLAMPLWLNVVDDSLRSMFFTYDWQHWIDLNMQSTRKWSEEIAWKDYWATACHCLWSWRNKEEHDEQFQRPPNIVLAVTDRVKHYNQAMVLKQVLHSVEWRVVMINWRPPNEGWVKINADGACKEGSAAGCGCVIRDSDGVWRGGFAKNLGMCSAYVAELWGVFEGLRYARSLGFNRVELNVDSSVVNQVLRKPGYGRPLGGSLVMRIRKLLELDWEVVIDHVYREANKCADMLANIGCTLDTHMVYYDICPIECHSVMLADVLGIETLRSIPV
jgi:ribonuclease HI